MLRDRILDLLERLGTLRRADQRAAAPEDGLLPVHFEVLAYLAQCNRYSDTPAAVAEYLRLTRGTVSQSLQLLERRGLVSRSADPEDGRRAHLALTRHGRSLAGAADADWAQAVGALGAGERGRLERGLDALLRELQRARGGRTFGQCSSCRFLRHDRGAFRCGLTGEPLRAAETGLICREHEPA